MGLPRKPSPFDIDAFYHALDRKRRDRRLHWTQVCKQAGVHASLMTRISLDVKEPSVPNLIRLMLWLGETDLAPYIRARVVREPASTMDEVR